MTLARVGWDYPADDVVGALQEKGEYGELTLDSFVIDDETYVADGEGTDPIRSDPNACGDPPANFSKTLPNALLIGDSISMQGLGYGNTTLNDLAGVVSLQHAGGWGHNGDNTAHGLECAATWLGNNTWDVVHMNFGLHDLAQDDERIEPDAYALPRANRAAREAFGSRRLGGPRVSPAGTRQTSPRSTRPSPRGRAPLSGLRPHQCRRT